MIPSLRKAVKRRKICMSDSCDSNSDTSLYKKSQIEMHKQVKRNLNKIFDGGSSQYENSSHNVQWIKLKDNKEKSANIAERNNDTSSKHTVNYQHCNVYTSESDNNNIEVSRQHKINDVNSKKNAFRNFDSVENPCISSSSLIENRKQFSKASDNKKDSNNVEINTRHGQIIDSSSSATASDLNSPVKDTFVKQNKKENKKKKKQKAAQSFEPYLIKIIDRLKHTLSKYKLHATRLESKFLNQDVATSEDAEDMTFIFTCIISKLKEELNKHEQELTNSYIQWSMNTERNRTFSNVQNRHRANDTIVQVQSQRHTESNSDDELFLPSGSKTQSLQITESSKNNVKKNNKDAVLQQNIRNHTDEKSLKTNVLINTAASNDNNVGLQSNENMSHIFDKPKEVHPINVNSPRTSTIKKNTEMDTFGQNYSYKSEQSLHSEHDSNQKESDAEILIIDSDSEISGTCSTMILAMCSSQSNNRHCNDKGRSSSKNTSDSSSNESHNVIPKITTLDNDVQISKLSSSDSDDTIMIPLNNQFRSNDYSRIKVKPFSALSYNKNSSFQHQSNFRISKNCLRPKYRFEPKYGIYRENFNSSATVRSSAEDNSADKKLQMNCRVLIDKCNR